MQDTPLVLPSAPTSGDEGTPVRRLPLESDDATRAAWLVFLALASFQPHPGRRARERGFLMLCPAPGFRGRAKSFKPAPRQQQIGKLCGVRRSLSLPVSPVLPVTPSGLSGGKNPRGQVVSYNGDQLRPDLFAGALYTGIIRSYVPLGKKPKTRTEVCSGIFRASSTPYPASLTCASSYRGYRTLLHPRGLLAS